MHHYADLFNSHCRLNQFEQAEKALKEGLKTFPEDSILKSYEEALPIYRKKAKETVLTSGSTE